MNRRDFSILATTGILGASSSGVTNAMTPASRYRKQSFNAVGSSKRLITLGGLNVAGIPQGPLYSVVCHTNSAFTLNRDGTGVSEGRSIRTVSGIIDPTVNLNNIPFIEIVSWSGLFEYHIENGVVSVYFKSGNTHGIIEEGPNKGQSFEEDINSPSGTPDLSGFFSKDHKTLLLHSNGLATRRTIYSNGKQVISTWSHSSTSSQG